MVTVGELIGLLQKYPYGYRVVVPGYEGGIDDILPPRKVEIDLDVNPQKYYGAHEEVEGGSPAVLLVGTRG